MPQSQWPQQRNKTTWFSCDLLKGDKERKFGTEEKFCTPRIFPPSRISSPLQNVKRPTIVPCREAGVDGALPVLMKPKPAVTLVSTWPPASTGSVRVLVESLGSTYVRLAAALVEVGVGIRARLKIFENSARILN